MNSIEECSALRLSLPSPEEIRGWSYGEVIKPHTLNYRTLKPEKDGLLCERIFGPTKDWSCFCGRYKGDRKKKGGFCDQCRVEVTRSTVRRERMGHIELAAPVSHIWFAKGVPSYMSLVLGLSPRSLASVLYYATSIVTYVDEEARGQQLGWVERELAALPADPRRPPRAERRGKGRSRGESPQTCAARREIEERRERELVGAQLAESETLSQLRAAMGGEGAGAILFGPTDQVIAQEGLPVTTAHLEELERVGQAWREAISEQARSSLELLSGDPAQDCGPLSLHLDSDVETNAADDEASAARQRLERLRADLVGLRAGALLGEGDIFLLRESVGDIFRVGMGAGAIRELLSDLDLNTLAQELCARLARASGQARQSTLRRLRAVEAFRSSGIPPERMVLTVLPVLPPELRPVVQLDGGRLATSDLNDLYRRVISRNRRVKDLVEMGAPGIILRNEQRLLQESVDSLFDNGRRGRAATGSGATGARALKSLAGMLRGKQGRFRQNLLGKRVDYSGRSVIVVGPELKLHQCGLPKMMALELFKPFVMRRLVQERFCSNVKSARRFVEQARPEVWDVLEEVITDHPVLLNRPPTLHRQNIMAFLPVLIEGSAIQLHPLVCSAFNADFDGDQMAVHVPLSPVARQEALQLLLSSRNLLSPATGEPTVGASQDMVLGVFYLTEEREGLNGEGRVFSDGTDAALAYEHGIVALQARIRVRIPDARLFGEPPPAEGSPRTSHKPISTTVGRLLFNEALPEALRFKNYAFKKEHLRELLAECNRRCGSTRTAELADAIKRLGFTYATKAGVTIAISDVGSPQGKQAVLDRAHASMAELERQYAEGLITGTEKYQQTVDIWNGATEAVGTLVQAALDPYGSISTIARSGATKARLQQIRQLSGMRGLMASPSGRIIDVPILGNFREGLSVLEYFISSHGARKGLSDTALRTAESGHLTRRLVDVAQDVIVTEQDCGTADGLLVSAEESAAMGLESMGPRLLGRILAEAVRGLPDLSAGDELDEAAVSRILACGARAARVRSPLCCQARRGICRRCYGRDLSTGRLVGLGAAVGIIAAQSIGEPGTQLTLRTFHTGGIAGAQGDITLGLPRVEELFEARTPRDRAEISEIDGVVEIVGDEVSGARTVRVVSTNVFFDEYPLPEGSQILVSDHARVRKDEVIALRPGAISGGEPVDVVARTAGDAQIGPCGQLCIRFEERDERDYPIAPARAIVVTPGQTIQAGAAITAGSRDPQDILRIQGREAAQMYLVKEVQRVYRNTGVYINDKHAEVIIRQMLRRVRVDEPGDSELPPGELLDRFAYQDLNTSILAQGGEPATARALLLGITRASLSNESWLAAASFQDTTRVLTRAAIAGQVDRLVGLKENVIIGRMIPAGSGFVQRRAAASSRQHAAPASSEPNRETGQVCSV